MSKYPAYSVYKASGVEWLGEVPEHWEVAILKRKFNVQLGKMLQTKPISEADTEEEYLCAVNIQPNGLDLTNIKKMWFSENDKNKYELKKGDLLVSEGGDVGRSVIYDLKQTLYIQNAINRIRPIEKDLTKFLYYWIYSLKIKGYIDIICNKSTISHFTAEKVEAIETLLPPPKEQQQIAAFLDNKTAHLDSLIEKKQQMIGLLNEKRIALITQAVTKGLDLSVPMKDSGVEWLGSVPEHWQILSIKRLTLVQRGASPRPIQDQKYFDDDGEFAWVRISDVTASNHYLETTTQRLSELGASFSICLQPNQLFLSIAGSVGKPIITKIKCCIHDGFVYFPNLEQNVEFLYYIFETGQPYLGLGKLGTQLNLNSDTVGDIKIGLPCLEEQQKIVDYLDQETQKIDDMIKTVKQAITTLQEYRTALITAAVTGKIDVRTLTPHEG